MRPLTWLAPGACLVASFHAAVGFYPSPITCPALARAGPGAMTPSTLCAQQRGGGGSRSGERGGRGQQSSGANSRRSPSGGAPRGRSQGGPGGSKRLPREFASYGNEGQKSGFMRNEPAGDREFLEDDFDLDELLGDEEEEGPYRAPPARARRGGSEEEPARGRSDRGAESTPRQPRKGLTDGERRRIERRNTAGQGAYGSKKEEDEEEEEEEEELTEEEEEERRRWEYYESLELEPIEYREETFGDGQGGMQAGERLADQFFFSKKAFGEIGASKEALQAIESIGLVRPSKIQTIAFPHVLSGTTSVLAEQTGSGKTLAYLLPLLQRLRTMEVEGGLGRAKPRSPRAVVLAPTAELAAQVTAVARSITRHMPLRVVCVTGGNNARTQKRMLEEGVDVIIGTPGRVQYLIDEGQVVMRDVQTVVLDEVDVLFLDDSFDLSTLGRTTPAKAQFVFVTATLPVAVADQISREFPGVKKLLGPGLHKIAPQVEEVLIDCSGPEDEEKREETAFVRKRDMMVQNLLKRPAERTLVFCNSIPNCRRVENALRRADRRGQKWRVLPYHSALAPAERSKSLELFSKKDLKGTPVIMVCTDRTSRGVDFEEADVEHVLLFDFPRDPSEYLRRVGRTGRAGRVGRVTALVLGKQVSLARSIMEGNKKGQRVHPVPQ